MGKSKTKYNVSTLLVMAVVLIGLYILLLTGSIKSRAMTSIFKDVSIAIILAVSLNLVVGFLGELSLGHAGFMSVGAYAGCYAAIKISAAAPNLSPWIYVPLCIIIGGLTAALFGAVVGIAILRFSGDYLAIVTLAFGEIIKSVVTNLEFLGAAGGLKGTPQLKPVGDAFYYFTLFIWIIITLVFVMTIINSRQGRAITAIRDNEIAAASVGLNITYYKLFAFVAAAFFAGVAGVLYGMTINLVRPTVFDFNKSIEILLMVVIGGLASIRGSIIGAVIITALPQLLRNVRIGEQSLSDYRMIIYSLLLIALMLLNNNARFIAFKGRIKQRASKSFDRLIGSGKKSGSKEVEAE